MHNCCSVLIWRILDLDEALLNGDTHVELAFEPAGPAERRLDDPRAVGRRRNDNAGGLCAPVHQRQELAHEALLDLIPRPSCGWMRWS